jgi:uncharacterized protein YciI
MSGFLIVLGGLAAVLFVFVRVFRARVQRRMEGVEMPAELAAARRSVAAREIPAVPAAAPRAAAGAPMAARAVQVAPHFMLIYDLVPDYAQRRGPLRDQHLALAWKAAEAGELVLGGALEEGAGQAFLLFRGSREAALRFAGADPYVKHGLVKVFHVRQWHTVVGPQAATPLRPKA